MKKHVSLFILCSSLFFQVGCFAAKQPCEDELLKLGLFFSEGVSTGARVQLFVLTPGVFIDPPPTEMDFPKCANVTIAVDALSAYKFANDVLKRMRNSTWTIADSPGYPRWCWRVLNSSHDVVFNVLVDEETSKVYCGGKWYVVDRDLTKILTHGFFEFSTKTMFLPIESRLEAEAKNRY